MYVTFVEDGSGWRLIDGIGIDGEPLLVASHQERALDASPAARPVVWVCGEEPRNQAPVVLQISLDGLRQERLPSPGRITAIASSPDGTSAAVLRMPESPPDMPELHYWAGDAWAPIECSPAPDISTGVAWLPERRVAFESSDRRLCVVSLRDGSVALGPAGSMPRVSAKSLFALCRQRLVRFELSAPFSRAPEPVGSFARAGVVRFSITRDEAVCSWSEARVLYRSRAYVQRSGQRRRRLHVREGALVAVMGPFDRVGRSRS